jgi:hypothetical protein
MTVEARPALGAVIIEASTPTTRLHEIIERFVFYQRNGVEEFYLYYPASDDYDGWVRGAGTGTLEPVDMSAGFVSSRLGIRFGPSQRETDSE